VFMEPVARVQHGAVHFCASSRQHRIGDGAQPADRGASRLVSSPYQSAFWPLFDRRRLHLPCFHDIRAKPLAADLKAGLRCGSVSKNMFDLASAVQRNHCVYEVASFKIDVCVARSKRVVMSSLGQVFPSQKMAACAKLHGRRPALIFGVIRSAAQGGGQVVGRGVIPRRGWNGFKGHVWNGILLPGVSA